MAEKGNAQAEKVGAGVVEVEKPLGFVEKDLKGFDKKIEREASIAATKNALANEAVLANKYKQTLVNYEMIRSNPASSEKQVNDARAAALAAGGALMTAKGASKAAKKKSRWPRFKKHLWRHKFKYMCLAALLCGGLTVGILAAVGVIGGAAAVGGGALATTGKIAATAPVL